MIIPVKTVYFSWRFSFHVNRFCFTIISSHRGKNVVKDLSMEQFFCQCLLYADNFLWYALGNDCARKLCSILGCPISYLHPFHCKSLLATTQCEKYHHRQDQGSRLPPPFSKWRGLKKKKKDFLFFYKWEVKKKRRCQNITLNTNITKQSLNRSYRMLLGPEVRD